MEQQEQTEEAANKAAKELSSKIGHKFPSLSKASNWLTKLNTKCVLGNVFFFFCNLLIVADIIYFYFLFLFAGTKSMKKSKKKELNQQLMSATSKQRNRQKNL
jgi:hypothetical protein